MFVRSLQIELKYKHVTNIFSASDINMFFVWNDKSVAKCRKVKKANQPSLCTFCVRTHWCISFYCYRSICISAPFKYSPIKYHVLILAFGYLNWRKKYYHRSWIIISVLAFFALCLFRFDFFASQITWLNCHFLYMQHPPHKWKLSFTGPEYNLFLSFLTISVRKIETVNFGAFKLSSWQVISVFQHHVCNRQLMHKDVKNGHRINCMHLICYLEVISFCHHILRINKSKVICFLNYNL